MLTADSATEAAWRHAALSNVADWCEATQRWIYKERFPLSYEVENQPDSDWFEDMKVIGCDLKKIGLSYNAIQILHNGVRIVGVHIPV